MSADGSGIVVIGLLVAGALPVVLAGAGIVGTVYGATKLAGIASRHASERAEEARREQARRAAEEAHIDAEERKQINILLNQFQEQKNNFAAEMDRLRIDRQASMKVLSDKLTKAMNEGVTDVQALECNTCAHLQAIERQWANESRGRVEAYQNQLQSIASDMRTLISTAQTGFDNMQKTVSVASLQREAIAQYNIALCAIKAVRLELGSVPENLERAIALAENYCQTRQFVTAYNIASNIQLSCYDTISAELAKRAIRENIEDQIDYQQAILEGSMATVRNFKYEYNGREYVEEDLSRFSPMLFTGILNRYNEIISNSDNSEVTLTQKLNALSDLNHDFLQWREVAVRQLLCACVENDYSQTVAGAMAEQGYRLEDYAYEGDVEGRAIHINFVNDVTSEKVTVVLTPDPDNGRLKVDVHDYGVDGTDITTDRNRQNALRENLENVLGISRMSCSDIGKASVRVSEADLDNVKTIRHGMPLL